MRLALPLAMLAIAGCSQQNTDNQAANTSVAIPDNGIAAESGATVAAAANTPAAVPSDAPSRAPTYAATPIPPGQPGGLPDDRTPVSEAPFTEDSAQGAANVVQTYYALLESGRYAQAYRLWAPGRAGMSAGDFAKSFARYSEYHAQVGAPGRTEGAAGSRYVSVPVQVYGMPKGGGAQFNLLGSVSLRRAGEVDGATPEQRRWHLYSIDLKPSRGSAGAVPGKTEDVADNRSTARYRCMDGSRLEGRFDPDNNRVTVLRGGKVLATLAGQRSASGIRYAAKGYELRAKGRAMTFTAPGEPPIACQAIN
jgi:membrane-bound inhibitor of C-type lysozyme